MRTARGILIVGLSVLAAASCAIAPAAVAQDSTSTTRKVKTKVAPDYSPLAEQMNIVGKVKREEF
jgi:hypothetical protein